MTLSVEEPRSIALVDSSRVSAMLDDYLSGGQPLTGLELYYELERATPLLEFHTIIRHGPQNRTSSGLQQTYGDHNRLLMHAVDKLVEGDLDWYRTRLDGSGDVSDDALQECLDGVAGLPLTPQIVVALWLAGAMHDCGMLCGRGSYVDVEDGIVLSHDVIDSLCPDGLNDLSYFVLHNHDYIKDVFLGEVPTKLVADELATLDESLRATALAGLGIVQVAGASSLGDGRLSKFRVDIFGRCLRGDALDDTTRLTRLSRLLDAEPSAAPRDPNRAERVWAGLDESEADAIGKLLDDTPVHGWQRAMASAGEDERTTVLSTIARYAEAKSPVDHVIVAGSFEPAGWDGPSAVGMETALSGRCLMLFEL